MILVFAIIAALGSAGMTFLVMLANGMSDAPSAPFTGGWFIGGCWAVTAGLFLCWALR